MLSASIMSEYPKTEHLVAPEVENETTRRVKLLEQLARSVAGRLLTEKDWKDFSMEADFGTYEMPSFEWAVFVGEYKGKKHVQLRVFNEQGVYDILEYTPQDQSLAITPESPVMDIINQRADTYHQKKAEEKRKNEQEFESQRGFPAGPYELQATYLHRSGQRKTVRIHEIRVEPRSTRADVLQDSLSWVSMYGLHNNGLDTEHPAAKINDRNGFEVELVLKNSNGVEVPFRCLVDASGHILRDQSSS
jgi:hypothetical protein